jgi:hypothetical protein
LRDLIPFVVVRRSSCAAFSGTGVKELKKLETPSVIESFKSSLKPKQVSVLIWKKDNYIEKRMVEYTLGSLS